MALPISSFSGCRWHPLTFRFAPDSLAALPDNIERHLQ
jgi:hypothetical protein